jgi:hypothetical protein
MTTTLPGGQGPVDIGTDGTREAHVWSLFPMGYILPAMTKAWRRADLDVANRSSLRWMKKLRERSAKM